MRPMIALKERIEFTDNRKRRGPKMEPCGTPELTSLTGEETPIEHNLLRNQA